MATTTSHNKKSGAVKRILSEVREVRADASTEYWAGPLEDNIFEWHFTLRGPAGTEFEKGCYHGRIILPAEYPMRPPSLMMLTPNGRWELNKKICLTFTGFHEEQWQPAWGIRTAVLGVQQFMGAREQAAVGVGSLDYPLEERERLAGLSKQWRCPTCNTTNIDLLPDPDPGAAPRVQTALPGGLTIDTTPKKKAGGTAEEPGSSAAASTEAALTAVMGLAADGPVGDPQVPMVPVSNAAELTDHALKEATAAIGVEPAASSGAVTHARPQDLGESLSSREHPQRAPIGTSLSPVEPVILADSATSALQPGQPTHSAASTTEATTRVQPPRTRMPTPAELAAMHQDVVKLNQLDRTIKLVAALVAILIVRQIW